MKQLALGHLNVQAQARLDGSTGLPQVHLRFLAGASVLAELDLAPSEARALADLIEAAMCDPEDLAHMGHDGHHPEHDPGFDPATLAHRHPVGAPGFPAGVSAVRDDEG